MEEVWPPELAALLDRTPRAELAATSRRLLAHEGITYRPPGEDEQPWAHLAGRGAAGDGARRAPLKGVIFADSTGSVMDVAVDMIRVDRG